MSGGIPGIIPPHIQFELGQEMNGQSFDPQTQWNEFAEQCRDNPGTCTSFDRIREGLQADTNMPLADEMRAIADAWDDPMAALESAKQSAGGTIGGWIDSAKGAMSNMFNNVGYDGWQPADDAELTMSADRMIHNFLREAAGGKVEVETMERVDQLREQDHNFTQVTQFYIDQVDANPANYGLAIETDEGQLESAAELGNEGNVYTPLSP